VRELRLRRSHRNDVLDRGQMKELRMETYVWTSDDGIGGL